MGGGEAGAGACPWCPAGEVSAGPASVDSDGSGDFAGSGDSGLSVCWEPLKIREVASQ